VSFEAKTIILFSATIFTWITALSLQATFAQGMFNTIVTIDVLYKWTFKRFLRCVGQSKPMPTRVAITALVSPGNII
jgi:hypothetical protein